MSNEIAKTNGVQSAKKGMLSMLEASQPAIAAALPSHITPERMMRVARTAIQTTPALLKCNPSTVIASIVEASQLGLEPNGILGEGYLIPFFNNKTKATECQFMTGYRGYITLARRTGEVQSISAEVVYSEDFFEYEFGLDERLVHRPFLGADRGEAVAAWALCKFKDGGHHFVVLPFDEIEGIRKSSKAKDSGPWATHWQEMAKKTAIRRLVKYLPLSPQLQRAAIIDEYAEAGSRPGEVMDLTAVQTESLKARLYEAAREDTEADTEDIPAERNDADTRRDGSV